jgi:MYXO-CTERM domain-containing protein
MLHIHARRSVRVALAVCALALICSGAVTARADLLTGTVFLVEARTASGSHVAQNPVVVDASELGAVEFEGVTYYCWALPLANAFEDQFGDTFAVLHSADVMYRSDTELGIAETWSFQSLIDDEDVIFTITSALVTSTPAIGAPVGNATATFNLSDSSFSGGAAFAGQYAGPKTMLASYNGMAPGGSEFVSLIAGLSIPSGSGDITDNYGDVAIGVPVSDMSTQVKFSLTPGDTLGGNVVYRILPEPAAGLLALGLLAFLRRR